MKQHIVRIALGLADRPGCSSAMRPEFYQIGFITQLDNIIYDTRLAAHHARRRWIDAHRHPRHRREAAWTVPELGRWPWGRDKIAALIKKLFDKYGVVIVGFDVVFAEPDESSGPPVLDKLAKRQAASDVAAVSVGAQRTAAAARLRRHVSRRRSRGRPVVLGYYFNSDEDARAVRRPPRAGAARGHVRRAATSASPPGTATAAICRSSRPTPPAPATSIRWSTPTACRGACRCWSNTRARITRRCRSR